MFGFLKNKAVDFVTDDLVNCINYLAFEASNDIRQQRTTQIANTMRHWLSEIVTGRASHNDVLEHLRKQKSSAMSTGRDFFRNGERAAVYICWSFFVFLLSHDNPSSKIGIARVFDLCEKYCDPDAAGAVMEMTRQLRLDLKIPE